MNFSSLLLTTLASIALAGCAGSGARVPESPPTAFGCPVANKRDTAMEDLIQHKVQTAGRPRDVSVTGITCSSHSDALRIDLELRNDSDTPQRVAYRFRWLGRDGLPAWEEESLKPILIYPHAAHQLVGLAPTEKAVDFRFFFMPQEP